MLPMPGAPIYTEDLRERFRIRYEGTDEVDGVPVYKIRYTAEDRDAEFFNYIVYYIDIETFQAGMAQREPEGEL